MVFHKQDIYLIALAFLFSSSTGFVLESGANLANRAFFLASSSLAEDGTVSPNLRTLIKNN